jgi:hypothetical protein
MREYREQGRLAPEQEALWAELEEKAKHRAEVMRQARGQEEAGPPRSRPAP